jgi:hypothetical protein
VNAPFLIRPESGHIRFPDLHLELHPLMPQAEFITATSSLHRDDGSNGPWQRYSIRELIPDDRRLGIGFYFLDGRLKRLSFACFHKDESWATWTEAGELAWEKEYQRELATQLSGKNTFPWGTVHAEFDRKSGGAGICVNYS